MRSHARLLVPLVGLLLLLAGCTSGDPKAGTSSGGSATAHATAPAPARASAAPAPADRTCHRLSYAQALAPTTTDTPVPCRGAHTSQTYAVGRVSTEVSGHLVAIDSPRVQRQVRTICPRQLGAFLGASTERLRLSMLRPVWFTPTVAASDQGADWFRCDVIAVAGDQQLASLTGTLKGALGGSSDTYGMCGTAEPGTTAFRRVLCRERHSWRALRSVSLGGGAYPGAAAAKAAGQRPCQAAGKTVAKDALDYKWGYEWPTAAQWAAGQTYGICWAPG
ncbi:hypothetical protein JCM18899A_36470 [Nocardioides sp. AN3]